MTAPGYPGSYPKGSPIEGIDSVVCDDSIQVFHAGTVRDAAGRLVTNGGRVLGVSALGRDVAAARTTAYEVVGRIRWEGVHYRTDIALDAIGRSVNAEN